MPRGFTYEFHVTSRVVAEVELAVKPESVALGAFGGIAALVILVLGVQAISRQLRFGDEDRQVLRALGAGPASAAGEGLIGVFAAVVLGSLFAVAVAVGLSPLAPLGPVRAVYPNRGIAFDWTVLGVGLAVLVGRTWGRRGGAGLIEGRPIGWPVPGRPRLAVRASHAEPKPRGCRWLA